MRQGIAPYILAGGQSSRMGRDKAMIALGGKTLLARAVDTLRSAGLSGSSREGTRVTVIGERTLLEGADRSICDRYPGCGPLGGMEAALSDLECTQAAEWAFFLPVDMPFLPAGLIDSLLSDWIAAGGKGARVCHAVIEGRSQPLVSMIHRELHPLLEEALRAGEFRVTPVLRSVCERVASVNSGALGYSSQILWQSYLASDQLDAMATQWSSDGMERRPRHLWFSNLNTQNDLVEAETFL